MTYAIYIAMLEKLKSEAVLRFIGSIPAIERQAYTALIEWLNTSMQAKDGRLEPTDETIRVLEQFERTYLKILNNMTEYNGAVTRFLKDVDQLSNAMQNYQQTVNKIDWAKANIKPMQKLLIDRIMLDYEEAGLAADFVKPLRDRLYQNTVMGSSFKEVQDDLRKLIVSPEGKSSKLKSYITSTAQQATDSYTGALNKRLMETFDYPYLIMSGSLIATSSPQCRKAITEQAGIFDEEYFKTVLLPIATENGIMQNTTFKKLPFNKLHWGCRHEFTPSMVLPKNMVLKTINRGKKQTV